MLRIVITAIIILTKADELLMTQIVGTTYYEAAATIVIRKSVPTMVMIISHMLKKNILT